jgi:hypothetical protein
MPACEICCRQYASSSGIRGHYLTAHQLEYRGRGRRPRPIPSEELSDAMAALRRRQVSRHPGSRRPARAPGSRRVDETSAQLSNSIEAVVVDDTSERVPDGAAEEVSAKPTGDGETFDTMFPDLSSAIDFEFDFGPAAPDAASMSASAAELPVEDRSSQLPSYVGLPGGLTWTQVSANVRANPQLSTFELVTMMLHNLPELASTSPAELSALVDAVGVAIMHERTFAIEVLRRVQEAALSGGDRLQAAASVLREALLRPE